MWTKWGFNITTFSDLTICLTIMINPKIVKLFDINDKIVRLFDIDKQLTLRI